LTSFLSNKRQKVVVNGKESKWESVLSGVPQGSIIGPILSIVFINDMPEAVNSFIQMFADDAKVFAEAASVEQRRQLQEDLIALLDWSRKWKLVFNAKKCKVMPLGKNNNMLKYYTEEEELDRLQALKLPSLLYRRQRGDMIEAYKFTHGLYKVEPSPLRIDTNNITRGHLCKLEKP
jgi:hypothetical protein